ncbi:MAG: DMT family transporter, partial [Delftia sp.]|nr:DMT family transporter [Delftia sp.]
IGCSLCWAGLDLLRKFLVARVDPVALAFWLTLGQLPGFAVWAVVQGPLTVSPGYFVPAAGATLLNVAALALFLHALRVSPFSVTIPLLSLSPVFAALFGLPLLGELPTRIHALGMALIILGAFSLNAGIDDWKNPSRLWRPLLREPGSLYMAMVALLWGITGLLDKMALRHATIGLHADIALPKPRTATA